MKLSACIVVYNGYDEALKAAQTVLHCTRRYPVTLYLVDNASPDGSGKKLEQAVADGLLAAGPGKNKAFVSGLYGKSGYQPFSGGASYGRQAGTAPGRGKKGDGRLYRSMP